MRRRPFFSVAVYAWMTTLLGLHAALSLLLLPWTLLRDPDRRLVAAIGSAATRASVRIPRRWATVSRQIAGVDLTRPTVVVVNHRSMADIAIAVALPGAPRLCAKPWVARVPLMGPAMRLAGHIVFDPADLLQVKDAMARLEGLARRGVPVLFFPEGTRRTGETLGPFEDGAFHVAVRAGVDVLPILFHGTGEVLPRGSMCFTDGPLSLTVLDRIPPGTDRKALKARVRAAMLAALSESDPPA